VEAALAGNALRALRATLASFTLLTGRPLRSTLALFDEPTNGHA
jgi:hypothetical protein